MLAPARMPYVLRAFGRRESCHEASPMRTDDMERNGGFSRHFLPNDFEDDVIIHAETQLVTKAVRERQLMTTPLLTDQINTNQIESNQVCPVIFH